MTIETFLTRELDIRFIDARQVTNEAKVSLGIHGYPTKTEMRQLRNEALRIFNSRPENVKAAMRRMCSDLETFKSSSSHGSDTGSEYSSSDGAPSVKNDDSTPALPRRTNSLVSWCKARR